MSAVLKTLEAQFEPMTAARIDEVVAIEQTAYDHPWARNHFVDSVAAGYQAQILMAGENLLGYFVAMRGVDEVHLLNITVTPVHQGHGWARVMLDALALWARAQGAQWLWLEVRISNYRAQRIYERYGFRRVGQRKNYYPAERGKREDAIVMSLPL
ncbi:MAG TPA: ribosomal protein S18-alanine N-acetyltransferase [Rhodoferax sp.]|jgi:ribosomal-protein-alanine N-acetyltransferase|nr:ribosomal protein S18-alanine N-acetyltransferase [Rhodoferax sp.]